MSTQYSKPIPIPDEETAPFWAAAREHQLAFQRCQHCQNFAHPPVTFCEHCDNVADPQFEFAPVSGRGRLVNWTVMYDAMVAGFTDDIPWIHALMRPEEQRAYTATIEDRVVPIVERTRRGDVSRRDGDGHAALLQARHLKPIRGVSLGAERVGWAGTSGDSTSRAARDHRSSGTPRIAGHPRAACSTH